MNREQRVYKTLRRCEPATLDELCHRSEISHGRVRVALLALEMVGLAKANIVRTAPGRNGSTFWTAPPIVDEEDRRARLAEAWKESKRMRESPNAQWTKQRPA